MKLISPARRHLLRFTAALIGIITLPAFAAASAPATSLPQVRVSTNLGAFTIELEPAKAPETVANFLKYVDDKQYNGTIFHRVIRNFMIQGGGMLPDMSEKPTRAPIKNEANNGLKNLRGSVAMARLPSPHSASAQFFINTVNNAFLDYPGQDGWGYCVFGRVVEGMDVVDKIAAVPTRNAGAYQNVPATPVVIQSVQRVGN